MSESEMFNEEKIIETLLYNVKQTIVNIDVSTSNLARESALTLLESTRFSLEEKKESITSGISLSDSIVANPKSWNFLYKIIDTIFDSSKTPKSDEFKELEFTLVNLGVIKESSTESGKYEVAKLGYSNTCALEKLERCLISKETNNVRELM